MEPKFGSGNHYPNAHPDSLFIRSRGHPFAPQRVSDRQQRQQKIRKLCGDNTFELFTNFIIGSLGTFVAACEYGIANSRAL
jgi:hypothetical protein